MDAPEILRRPLTGAPDELFVMRDIAKEEIELPAKGLSELVSKAALEILDTMANEQHKENKISDKDFVLIHAGIEKIRIALRKEDLPTIKKGPSQEYEKEFQVFESIAKSKTALPESRLLRELPPGKSLEDLGQLAKSIKEFFGERKYATIKRGLENVAILSAKGQSLEPGALQEEKYEFPSFSTSKPSNTAPEEIDLAPPEISEEGPKEKPSRVKMEEEKPISVRERRILGFHPESSKINELLHPSGKTLTANEFAKAFRHMQLLFRASVIREKDVDDFIKGVTHYFNSHNDPVTAQLKRAYPIERMRLSITFKPLAEISEVKQALKTLGASSFVQPLIYEKLEELFGRIDSRYDEDSPILPSNLVAERIISYIFQCLVFKEYGDMRDSNQVKEGLALIDISISITEVLPVTIFNMKMINQSIVPLLAIIQDQVFVTDSQKMEEALHPSAKEAVFTPRYGVFGKLQERYQLRSSREKPGDFTLTLETTTDGKKIKRREVSLSLSNLIKTKDPGEAVLMENALRLAIYNPSILRNEFPPTGLNGLSKQELQTLRQKIEQFHLDAKLELSEVVKSA